jgi:hypothetical protein
MQLIDWCQRLSRQPTDDATLGALCDWLEERGDWRVTLIKACRISPMTNNQGRIRRNWFRLDCPKQLGHSSNHRFEKNTRNVLSRRLYKFLLQTDA